MSHRSLTIMTRIPFQTDGRTTGGMDGPGGTPEIVGEEEYPIAALIRFEEHGDIGCGR